MTTTHSGRTVTSTRWMLDIDAPPFWRTQLGKPGNVDRWQIIRFEAPCTIVLDVGVAPAGTGAPQGDRSKGVNGRVLNTITPETDTTCMYFWSLMRNYRLRDQSLTTQLREANAKIFVEDQVVVEAQQRAIDERARRRAAHAEYRRRLGARAPHHRRHDRERDADRRRLMARYKILIAGAGLGGLAAASCLLKAGHDVEVYEQAPQLGEIGAGIQVSANAMHVLRHLGLERSHHQASACGRGAYVFMLHDTGEVIQRFSLSAEHERLHGAPYTQLHRADFHEILAARRAS